MKIRRYRGLRRRLGKGRKGERVKGNDGKIFEKMIVLQIDGGLKEWSSIRNYNYRDDPTML